MTHSRLKDIRIRHRIQVQELAHYSGLDPSTVSRIENGWRGLNQDIAQKLWKAYQRFRVSDDQLIEALGAHLPGPPSLREDHPGPGG